MADADASAALAIAATLHKLTLCNAASPSWRLSAARRGGPALEDVALQTFAAVPEQRTEVCLCNRAADPDRQAGLDRRNVSELRPARRNLLQEVVLRKRMKERHGMPG